MNISKITDTDKLYIFDTLHDFWKERGNKKIKQEEDEEHEQLDENTIKLMRDYLLSFIIR